MKGGGGAEGQGHYKHSKGRIKEIKSKENTIRESVGECVQAEAELSMENVCAS